MLNAAIFRPDDQYDRDHASDFESRYGAYLRQHTGLFLNSDDELTSNPLEFAAAAWRVAQEPVMSPAYITAHPRVLATTGTWDYDGRLAVEVTVADGVPAELARSLRGRWSGWNRSGGWFTPEDNDRPIATAELHFRIPMPTAGLPAPHYSQWGSPAIEVAKGVVGILCGRLNAALARVFAQFDRKEVA